MKLSQVSRKETNARRMDTSRVYSAETEKMLKEKYTTYDKDEVTGENIMNISLADVTIVAKVEIFLSVPVRSVLILRWKCLPV